MYAASRVLPAAPLGSLEGGYEVIAQRQPLLVSVQHTLPVRRCTPRQPRPASVARGGASRGRSPASASLPKRPPRHEPSFASNCARLATLLVRKWFRYLRRPYFGTALSTASPMIRPRLSSSLHRPFSRRFTMSASTDSTSSSTPPAPPLRTSTAFCSDVVREVRLHLPAEPLLESQIRHCVVASAA